MKTKRGRPKRTADPETVQGFVRGGRPTHRDNGQNMYETCQNIGRLCRDAIEERSLELPVAISVVVAVCRSTTAYKSLDGFVSSPCVCSIVQHVYKMTKTGQRAGYIC